jgi:hypothetical protein
VQITPTLISNLWPVKESLIVVEVMNPGNRTLLRIVPANCLIQLLRMSNREAFSTEQWGCCRGNGTSVAMIKS